LHLAREHREFSPSEELFDAETTIDRSADRGFITYKRTK
jgi:hypothetical protein